LSFTNNLRLISGFASHWLRAGDEHSVHSPFVFRLLTEAVYLKGDEPEYARIEAVRSAMLRDQRVLKVTDLGAGSTFDGRPVERNVREIAARFAKPPRYGRLLFRLTRFFRPKIMIELGTSLGISAMYQALGFAEGNLYTLEGCPETASVARENFADAGLHSIECITGDFDSSLSRLLAETGTFDYLFIDGNHSYEATLRYFNLAKQYASVDSVIVFDDINWSEGMKVAWKQICADEKVTISIDFFQLGLVFFNKGFSRQHFLLRYR
jgi:predicted O-methyltransferase YrrM